MTFHDHYQLITPYDAEIFDTLGDLLKHGDLHQAAMVAHVCPDECRFLDVTEDAAELWAEDKWLPDVAIPEMFQSALSSQRQSQGDAPYVSASVIYAAPARL